MGLSGRKTRISNEAGKQSVDQISRLKVPDSDVWHDVDMVGRFLFAGLLGLYALSGIYLIRGNEQGVIRRFGRLDPRLRSGGLHYDWPWPFARVDRVNRSEARTVAIGFGTASGRDSARAPEKKTASGPDTERSRDPLRTQRQPEYLTGDKNILHVQVQLQFTIADPAAWLLTHRDIDRLLARRAETLLVDRVAECGVDYVHPVGLTALQHGLLMDLRSDPLVTEAGIVVEDIAIPQISPPIEVKAAFLDVSTARAERDELIARETAAGDRRLSEARARSQAILDSARSQATAEVESSRARSNALDQLLKAVTAIEPSPGDPDSKRQRELVMNRLFTEFIESTFPRLKRVTFVAPGSSTDLLLPGVSQKAEPAPPEPSATQ